MEKIIISLIVLSLMIGPSMALNVTDEAYMQGLSDGYTFGALAIQGQGNAAAEAQYNTRVADLNAWLDEISWPGDKWAELVHVDGNYSLPRIFTDSSDWYKKEA